MSRLSADFEKTHTNNIPFVCQLNQTTRLWSL